MSLAHTLRSTAAHVQALEEQNAIMRDARGDAMQLARVLGCKDPAQAIDVAISLNQAVASVGRRNNALQEEVAELRTALKACLGYLESEGVTGLVEKYGRLL